MNPRIDQSIAPIALAPHTRLTHMTKEVIADAVSGGAWVNRTPRKISRKGANGNTTGYIFHAVSVFEPPSPVLIGIVTTSPPFGFNTIQQVVNIRQSTFPALVRHTQNLGTVVDGNFPDDLNSTSIFSKLICHKLSDGSSVDL